MAHPSFEVGKFKFWDRYEVHFGRDGEGFFFYEIEDLRNLVLVDVKDHLTEGEVLKALGCALGPSEFTRFQQAVHLLA